MAYYLQRRLWRRGPYSLEQLHQYLAKGKISLADQVRADGMGNDNWMPLGQLVGSSPLSAAFAPDIVETAALQSTSAVKTVAGPVPPQLHWLLLVLLGWITLGLFTLIWEFVQARFLKKIKPDSNCFLYALLSLIPGAGFIFFLIGAFRMRAELEEYYNTVEPMGLHLSGAMTLFFNTIYFQYHFYRIAQWKKTGSLPP